MNVTSVRLFPILFIALLCAACEKKPEPPAAPAPAAATPVVDENVHQFKIGELTAVALKGGVLQFPNDNKIFDVGHSPAASGSWGGRCLADYVRGPEDHPRDD